MLTKLKIILHKECQLETGKPLLVGVSGGSDSLFLLHCLQQLEFPLVVAHFDHQLRPESAIDREFVADCARQMGLDMVSDERDVRAYAAAHKFSLEAAARQARYEFLFEQAHALGVQAVVVGHTADDQVETVLMHLLRGTGLSGLSGMAFRSIPNPWSERIPLIRPLLNTWREEIETYLAERDLKARQDSTNQDRTYFRNRLRHELLPYLSEYQPHIKQHLHRLAAILQGDEEVVQSREAEVWDSMVAELGPGYVGLDSISLLAQPVGLQRRIIRTAMAHLRPGLQDVDFQAVERARIGLEKPPGWKPVDLAAGLYYLVGRQHLWIAEWQVELPVADWPQLPDDRQYSLPLPGELVLAHGWRIRVQFEESPSGLQEEMQHNQDLFHAWFDLEKIDLPVNVRPRRAADRMQPIGMHGHSVRLADVMIDAKLPRPARRRYPVIAAGENILWVPGLCRSRYALVTEGTKTLVRLACQRSTE